MKIENRVPSPRSPTPPTRRLPGQFAGLDRRNWEPVELSLQNSSGRFGRRRLLPPHPRPLAQGEGTPHPALGRVETLWIGLSTAGDSASPKGRGEWGATPEKPTRILAARG